MRSFAKSVAERVLLRAGPATIARWMHRGRGLVLAYHNIVPHGEAVVGDESLHLLQRRFAEQLDRLMQEGIDVVPLGEVVGWASEPQTDDRIRRVAITFDDGYRGTIQAGVQELVRRNLPATVFVVPGLVGGSTFWWDALAATDGRLSSRLREAALGEARGLNEEVVAWARRQGIAVGSVPEHAQSADEAELRSAADHVGIEMASHTWSHANLTALSEADCRRELARADAWVRKRFGRASRWLSYPYGLFDQAAQRAAEAVGHVGALRIDGGWLPRSPTQQDAFRLPRLNVPAGLSGEGFGLRVSGLF